MRKKQATSGDLRGVVRRIAEKAAGAQEVLSHHPGLTNQDPKSIKQAFEFYQQVESLLDSAAVKAFVKQED